MSLLLSSLHQTRPKGMQTLSTSSLCCHTLEGWRRDPVILDVAQGCQRKLPQNSKLSSSREARNATSTRCSLSGCIVPGLLEAGQHPLRLTVPIARLHLHHHLIEIDELGRAGRGATFPVRFFHRGDDLHTSGVLHTVHKSSQALVRVSLECLDL